MALEIAVAAAGIVLSPCLQMFFAKMASLEFNDFLGRKKLNDKLLKKLKMALLTVNAVLEDAEDRQFTETSVKEWLDEVKDTIYDSEDILDEIATENLQCKVRRSTFDVSKIESEIKDAIERLEDLAKQIGVLTLKVSFGGQPFERLPTTSLIEESNIYGREIEKNAIINSLLFHNASESFDNASESEIGVIGILGMGGIGKTTLAQLVYNDNMVKEHFSPSAWVCVSDQFDVFMVIKTILEEVGSPTNVDNKNLNQLQIKLKKTLTGKKFLLVLDDVWDMDYVKWEVLSNALKSGSQESKVIVTTRNEEVTSVMFASTTHRIMKLSEGDCWSLFEKYAFHNGDSNRHQDCDAMGIEIVKKCKGLPLAIKAIGALLWSKLDIREWEKVLKSKIWDLPIEETGIIPALRLSYKYLSPHLKRCFAYCSIFPKGHFFEKDKLVLLWMAEGFLPQLKNKTMKEVGDDYFLTLVSRSLLQHLSGNKYIMHDLISDLTRLVSREFALSLEDDGSYQIGTKTRHVSYSCRNIMNFDCFDEAFNKAERLRTIHKLNFIWEPRLGMNFTGFPLPYTRCLRVLILSKQEDLTELPKSISRLIHLRYLDISYTFIESLPPYIWKLCNLQILNLSHCWKLDELPSTMHKLDNLRHIDVTATSGVEKMREYLEKTFGGKLCILPLREKTF